jgi:hypothetical protein
MLKKRMRMPLEMVKDRLGLCWSGMNYFLYRWLVTFIDNSEAQYRGMNRLRGYICTAGTCSQDVDGYTADPMDAQDRETGLINLGVLSNMLWQHRIETPVRYHLHIWHGPCMYQTALVNKSCIWKLSHLLIFHQISCSVNKCVPNLYTVRCTLYPRTVRCNKRDTIKHVIGIRMR